MLSRLYLKFRLSTPLLNITSFVVIYFASSTERSSQNSLFNINLFFKTSISFRDSFSKFSTDLFKVSFIEEIVLLIFSFEVEVFIEKTSMPFSFLTAEDIS
ncbi:hypothetical protein D3C76_1296470 [compost metagenome]